MSQMLKSSGAMGVATLTSRVLGMVREMVYAAFMGDGPVASAFKLAFMVPNLFRRLLGEGALTAAFIPIFKDKERNSTPEDMWRAANAVISALFAVAGALVVVVMLGISVALHFGDFGQYNALMLTLLQIMFPYLIVVCLAAIFMGMMNARGHFFLPAMGATLLNGVMILTVLVVAPRFGETLDEQIFALAFGVLIAGTAQAIYQLPALYREGFRLQWVTPWKDETVRQVAIKMIPGTMGVAAFQLNVLITQSIAFKVEPSLVASFDYAVRLMELPQGVFGISLATFLLPTLAGLAADKKYGEFRDTLNHGLNHLLFVNVIASVLLVILAEPIVRLLFQRGQFDMYSTYRAAYALVWLAPGLIAFSATNILARAFYAVGDTATPMKISMVCLALNLIFALWLIEPYRQGGLALANTMSSAFNVWLLHYALRRKLKSFNLNEVAKNVWPVLTAAVLAGMVAWLLLKLWIKQIGHATVLARVGEVFVPALVAGGIYWLVAHWLKVPSANEVWGLVARKLKRKAK